MLYVCNTFFEWELEGKIKSNLRSALQASPISRQLQYLPLLFLDPEDTLIVTELPSFAYLEHLTSYGIKIPHLQLLEKAAKGVVGSWGASQIIKNWADQQGLIYSIPSLETVKKINSKIWNFNKLPHLEGAAQVRNELELREALKGHLGVWVLKTEQGFSGKGHCIFNSQEIDKAVQFSSNTWEKGQSLLLEPWVDRVLDFSSQWNIDHNQFKYLGVTKFFNTPLGSYLGTEVGNPEALFGENLSYVEEHLNFVKNYLPDLIKEGFFGCLGIDAMVYKSPKTGELLLHPILEVNARMTMSAAVLRFWQKYGASNQVAVFTFQSFKGLTFGLLPNNFNYQLQFKVK